MKRPKVISFDAGYTLVYPCYDQFNEFARKHFGLTFTPEQLKKAERYVRCLKDSDIVKSMPIPGLVIYFSRGLIQELLPDCMNDVPKLTRFLQDCAPVQDSWFSILDPNVIPCLERLKSLSFRLGVISNANGNVINNGIRYIRPHVEHIVDSGVVGFEKPDCRIFQHAYQLFGIEPGEMLHIGDSASCDVNGALNAGSQAALYDPDFLVDEPIPPHVPRFRSLLDFANSFCPPCT